VTGFLVNIAHFSLPLTTIAADGTLAGIRHLLSWRWPTPHYYFDIKDGHRFVDPSGLDFKNDDAAIAKAKVLAIGVSLDKSAVDPERRIAVLNGSREEFFLCARLFQTIDEHHVGNLPTSQAEGTQWHEKKSKKTTIRQTCATSATTRSMTDFQCGGSAWRHY
jgi:hypothetical protein